MLRNGIGQLLQLRLAENRPWLRLAGVNPGDGHVLKIAGAVGDFAEHGPQSGAQTLSQAF